VISSSPLTKKRLIAIVATVSSVINLAFLVLLYLTLYTPYLDVSAINHFTSDACGRDKTYILSHEAVDAQKFFRVSVCNEGLRSSSDGTYSVDNAAIK
jgi:hypothetical protein